MFLKSLIVFLFCLIANGNSKNNLSITLEDVSKAIEKHRTSKWKAKDNNTFNQFRGKTGPIFGLIEEEIPFDRTNKKYFGKVKNIPASIDWRNFTGENFLTPVSNQGRCGSCVAFASIAAIEGKLKIANLNPNFNIDLSEQHLWSCSSKKCSSGWMLSGGLIAMKSYGTPDESCFPYISGNMGEDFSCIETCSNSEDRKYKIKNLSSLGGFWANAKLEDIKKALLKGPVVAGMDVYEDFMYYSSGIYSHVIGDKLGGHAVSIVGYNDKEKAFIVKNSWGTNWGEKGFFRISYNDNSSKITKQILIPEIEKSPGFISFVNPQNFGTFLSDDVEIKAINSHKNLVEMTAYISEHKETSIIASIPLLSYDNVNFFASFDTSMVENGVYDLWIEGISKGFENVKPVYTTVYIINKEPQISLNLTLIDSKKKNLASFLLECSDYSVPLDYIDFLLTGPEEEMSANISSPCPKTKLNIDTTYFKNGIFTLVGNGKIGIYTFKTNAAQFEK